MNTRSVQFKFLVIVISAMVAITVFIGGLSIREVDNYIQHQTENIVKTTCSNETQQINHIFDGIEKSVKIMESYVLSLFEKNSDFRDRENQQEILQLSGEMFVDVAINTDGAVAYYLRFDPSISDGKTGMFYTKMDDSGEYTCLEPTDLSIYDKDDVEHVGWFWQPYEAGRPIWLDPYYNQNNGILMVSYVVPLYVENQFIGVVGMDFDYTVLTEKIHQIKIYENGFAHLEFNDKVIHYGKEIQNGDHPEELSEDYLQVSEKLSNGMTLVLSASYDDIRQIRYEIAYKILLIVILLALIFSLIVILIVRRIMKPLKKLTDASIKLSSGDYDIEIEHSDTYEIQQLNTAFEKMLVNLREHKKLQHDLAYRDSLTGLRNTTSYNKWAADFNEKIKEGGVSFGVVVLDINYLKEANDTYGHIVGNDLIKTASQIISDTFKRSPVFRIGGDEFVVILQNRDLQDRDTLFEKFKSECENSYVEADDSKIPVRIAGGFSLFDSAKDAEFSDVFDRADYEMYKNKKSLKAART